MADIVAARTDQKYAAALSSRAPANVFNRRAISDPIVMARDGVVRGGGAPSVPRLALGIGSCPRLWGTEHVPAFTSHPARRACRNALGCRRNREPSDQASRGQWSRDDLRRGGNR